MISLKRKLKGWQMSIADNIKDRELDKFRGTSKPTTKIAVEVEQSPDNPIPVVISESLPSGQEYLYEFQETSSVVPNAETLIFTKTVTDTKYFIDKIEVSGENKAIYNIYLDSTLINRKRTYYTYLNDVFNFGEMELTTGQVIEVKVEHEGPTNADFNATLIGLKIVWTK